MDRVVLPYGLHHHPGESGITWPDTGSGPGTLEVSGALEELQIQA